MDAMSLSLDEIIKNKSIAKKPAAKGPTRTNRTAASGQSKVVPVRRGIAPSSKIVDARTKIIQKNRFKIRDARDKLVEIAKNSGDARLRLLKRKGTTNRGNGVSKKRPISLSTKKKVIVIDDEEDVDFGFDMEIDNSAAMVPLRRTVKNDLAYSLPPTMPPLPKFGRTHSRHSPPPSWNSDPFDCYEVPVRRPVEKAPPPPPVPIRKQFRREISEIPRRGILRQARILPASKNYDDERPQLSTSMRARLEGTPNPNESMGIFAKMPPNDPPSSPSPPPPPTNIGYRIVVSNLHGSVTQNDIKELFEDIGDLLESRLVRPGVAEVIFRYLKEAEEAVDTYHNRQLDGQPMKCLLVKPRSSNNPTAPAMKYSSSSRLFKSSSSSLSSNKTPLEIDIDALHKVLFRRN